MSAYRIFNNIYSVGVLNPNMRIFDVIMRTEYGTSYNSYIVKGAQKTALIETCHEAFFDVFLANIREVCEFESIDYIILNHCEPDHSGSLARLMDYCKNATIIVSRAGSIYLKNITNSDTLPVTVVKDADKIDLGGGCVLTFISAPFLHWPDSMFTWLENDGVLFSCDFLGAHYCEPYVFDTNIAYPQKYESALKVYFDAIFSPFIGYVHNGLDKIAGLDINAVCTSHGPVLTKGCKLESAIEKYKEWCKQDLKVNMQIPVFYCSAYGNTAKIAQAICEGIISAIPSAVAQAIDINDFDMAELVHRLNSSDAFAIGSPTINSDAVPPVWKLLGEADAINNKKKPALVFGSYGWSGEAVPNIIARLNGLKMNVFSDGYRINFVPTKEDLKKAADYAREFSLTLNKN